MKFHVVNFSPSFLTVLYLCSLSSCFDSEEAHGQKAAKGPQYGTEEP